MVPLLFCIIVMFNNGVEGGKAQSISGYACSSSRDLKIWDASTRCKDESEENFKVRAGDQRFAVSSQVKLRCTASGDGGAPGCVGSLHTYAWSPPKTEGGFREIRTVKGKIGKCDFLAEDGDICCEITETQGMPVAVNIVLNMCRTFRLYFLHIFRWACCNTRMRRTSLFTKSLVVLIRFCQTWKY